MRKSDIINLVEAGILFISAHDLSSEHAYKVFVLKREIEKAHKAITEETEAILKEVGFTEDLQQKLTAIEKKKKAKEPLTAEEQNLTYETIIIQSKANNLIKQLNREEVSLSLKTIPYETWRELQKENRSKDVKGRQLDILGGPAETLLADIFWLPFEEKKEKETKTTKK